mgnify:FL=1
MAGEHTPANATELLELDTELAELDLELLELEDDDDTLKTLEDELLRDIDELLTAELELLTLDLILLILERAQLRLNIELAELIATDVLIAELLLIVLRLDELTKLLADDAAEETSTSLDTED